MSERVHERAQKGGTLEHGVAELWTVGAATALSLACLAASLYLVAGA